MSKPTSIPPNKGANEVRIVSWNVEWRRPDSRDGVALLERLAHLDPDLICLTEAHRDMFHGWSGISHDGGPHVSAATDHTRRRVVLWSKHSLLAKPVNRAGIRAGCLVTSDVLTPDTSFAVYAIVIPYHMADVVHGSKDKKPWEQHEKFLDYLIQCSPHFSDRTIVLGDFNQRLPASFPPKHIAAKLLSAFEGMEIPTAGLIGPDGKRPNDHIAHGGDWVCIRSGVISNERKTGGLLTDHFGTWVDLRLKKV